MTRILAFDQATVTGWCFGGTKIDFPLWRTGHFRMPKRDVEGERLVIIRDEVMVLCAQHQPDLVVWETPFDPTVIEPRPGAKPAIMTNRTTIRFLTKLEGVLQEVTARLGIPAESYAPRSWRTALKLPGINAQQWETWKGMTPAQVQAKRTKFTKDQTMLAVRRLGGRIETPDEADAWGLCFYACHGRAGIKRATGDLFERARNAI